MSQRPLTVSMLKNGTPDTRLPVPRKGTKFRRLYDALAATADPSAPDVVLSELGLTPVSSYWNYLALLRDEYGLDWTVVGGGEGRGRARGQSPRRYRLR